MPPYDNSSQESNYNRKSLFHTHRKEDPFARINKGMIYDERLSWKAKGILTYAFSRPDDWTFYKEEIAKHAKDGIDSLDSGLKELEKLGYLFKTHSQDKKTGKLNGHDWHFFEEPLTKEQFEQEFKKFNRKGDFPEVGNFPMSVKSAPTKKEYNTKNECNTKVSNAREDAPNENLISRPDYSQFVKRMIAEKVDWSADEIAYIWNALEKYEGQILDWWRFCEGTLEKHRIINENKNAPTQTNRGETRSKHERSNRSCNKTIQKRKKTYNDLYLEIDTSERVSVMSLLEPN